MTAEILVRYAHFLAIFIMFSLVTTQHMLLKGQVQARAMKKIAILDAAYGASALAVLLAGLSLWFWVGKPVGFYSHNWVFHTKITLFVLVALVSFVPTRFILKNRNTSVDITVPKSIVMCIRVEMLLLCIIPLLAVLMASGVGYVR
jgi:putative membrane protein